LNQKIFKVCFVVFVLVLLSLPFSSNANRVRSQNDELLKSEIAVQMPASENVLGIEFWVFLAENYQFFDVSIRNEVMVNITANLREPLTRSHVISVIFTSPRILVTFPSNYGVS